MSLTFDEDVMPKVNGQSFKCSCGCNVFRKVKPENYYLARTILRDNEIIYQCNSCGIWHVGEK